MKKLLVLLLALTFLFSFSAFSAENGENVYLKVWDSTNDDVPEDLWDIEYMGDMDGDGFREFAVCTDEGGAIIYLYECVDNDDYAIVWQYAITADYCVDSYVLCKGDLDGDGLEEIIAGVATSGAGQFGVHIFEWDGVTGSDNYVFQTMYDVGDGEGGSITICEAGDFDGDGVQELFLGETINDDIFIVSLDTLSDFDFPTWNIEFEDRLDDDGDYSLWGFTSGDFDNDGFTELAITEWDYNALIVIQVDDVNTYSRELWWDDMTHPNDGAALRSLCAYDLDGDGFTEIIIPSTNGTVYTVTNTGTFVDLNLSATALDSITTLPDITGAALGNQDMYLGNIGEPDIYVAGWYGIYDLEFTGGDYTDAANWHLYTVVEDTNVRWQQAIVGDFDRDGLKEFAVARRDGPPYIDIYEHEPLERGDWNTVATVDSAAYLYQVRCVAAGSDLDEDGKKEVFVTDYRDGGFIHGFEVVADNTLEWIWSSDTVKSSAYAANRNVVTGDFDNDGIGEVIFAVSGNSGDADAGTPGLNFYEWDGTTDNGFSVYARINIDDNLNSDRWRFEQISAPFDVDGDGINEMCIANNGSDHTLGDKFYVISIDGDFESGLYSTVIEAAWNQGEHEFNGSPYYGNYGDLDGDGTYEIVFSAWDHAGAFIVDVTGADTYEFVNYIYMDPWLKDYVCYGGTAIADFDGDGRDEVMGNFYGNYATVILNIDGDISAATAENSVASIKGPYGGGGWKCDAADFDGDGKYEFYTCNYNTHHYEFKHLGGDVMESDNWQVKTVVSEIEEEDGFGYFSVDATDDLDGDGYPEIVLGYLESFDFDPQVWLKVIEYTGDVGVEKNWRIITPNDYKLSQNFPNPFNPTTQISFDIPLAKDVTLKIYDMLGHEVRTLISEHKQAGAYTITWDGNNKTGKAVSAGSYIYELKAGHVVLSKVMTLIK